ncbi:MAG: class I SAM-dependent DNA methyltransferase [Acidimicrobiales bacterium]
MDDYEPGRSFDADAAPGYDARHVRGDETDTVAFLAELAAGRPALELAIGTGRIALPLAARGVSVDGIDLSPAMVEQLRAKPGGDQLTVIIGNFADVAVDGTYGLVYLVFNTLYNLLSQDEQVRCFENVASHLADDGVFVVEGMVPSHLMPLRHNQYVDAEAVGVDEVRLDVARYDPVTQQLDENHVTITTDGIGLNPIVTRYIWPSEMDLMARLAGLRLIDRWGGWRQETFTADSKNAVSVYGR